MRGEQLMATHHEKREVTIAVRVTPDEYRRIKRYVLQRGSNPSLYAYHLLVRDVDEHEERPEPRKAAR